MHDDSRTATFSSSSAWKLFTTGKGGKGLGAPALKYIKQVRQEGKLGRSIKNQVEAKQTSWGTFLESRVFKMVDTSYQHVAHQGRLVHPDHNRWTGIPDFLSGYDTVSDCKCPFNPEKFCDKMEALQDYGTFKKEFPEDFWQLVSNLVLLRANGLDINFIEAVNYMPYRSELDEIRMCAGDDKSMRWLEYTPDEGLPWLPDGGHYKNLNIHRFQVMERDVDHCNMIFPMCIDIMLGIREPDIVVSGARSKSPKEKAIITKPPVIQTVLPVKRSGSLLKALERLNEKP
jgi:hypothetical protein